MGTCVRCHSARILLSLEARRGGSLRSRAWRDGAEMARALQVKGRIAADDAREVRRVGAVLDGVRERGLVRVSSSGWQRGDPTDVASRRVPRPVPRQCTRHLHCA